jgi:antitoxin HicB
MGRFTYPATLTPASAWDPEETGFVVALPDFPEAHTQGETVGEALAAAADCLRVVVEGRMRDGADLPSPTAATDGGSHPVPLPPLLAAKAALYLSMRERGVSNSALARLLGCDEKEVRRMLDPRHPTKLPRLDAALRVLGRQLVVDVRDAA